MGTGKGGNMALRGGNRLIDNLAVLKEKFNLNESGYFGSKGRGRGHTRNIESSNPARTAAEFASYAGMNPVRIETISNKGTITTLRDGSIITHRFYSSSSDRTPTVELKVQNVSEVKSQKIHFTKKKER